MILDQGKLANGLVDERTSMIEVLKQALEAFECGNTTSGLNDLHQAIAELESQEPVAWRVRVETKLRDGSLDVGYQLRNEKLSAYDEPLYTHPPQRTEQEPMSWHESILNQKKFLAEMEALLVKTSTPQRTWQGLTNKEIEEIKLKAGGNVFSAIMFTNDRLEEKNT